ncbi:SMI1/KNR4 family protein [Nonomuraea mangrovi]|uniref:SMI1/KNR4 family protein n=1 Tax=Nonomuraea mangrovi TaxID=2316207 RepID=A0ABW4TA13_9ACTN
MLKLLRMALIAVVLAAIAIRIDRRTSPSAPVREPVLGRPTPEDLERYHRRPVSRFLNGLLAGLILGLLVAGVGTVAAITSAGEAEKEREQLVSMRARSGTAEQGHAPEPSIADVPTPSPSPSPAIAPTPDPACAPERRAVVVRPLDPQVKRQVDAQWRRLERWLRRNAPVTYASLRGPGRARTIAVAESQTGLRFPDDLRASLLRHNGGMPLGPDKGVGLGIREIRDGWRSMCRGDMVEGDDPRAEYWNGRMIPFLLYPENDENRIYAVIDSVVGDVRWVDGWDDGGAGVGPSHRPSYLDLLRANADALQRGAAVDGWRPRVVRGAVRWEPAG